jgi:GNAT superfamily N-acetyltransferase
LISNFSLLQNEVAFDELFCEVLLGSRFSIYYNVHFSEDPIFNHVKFTDELLASDANNSDDLHDSLREAIGRARKLGIPASLYVERFWKNARNLEKTAIDLGFLLIEQMHVLRKEVSKVPERDTSDARVQVLPTKNIALWSRAFTKAFAIPERWIPELHLRLRKIAQNPGTLLLIALEDDLVEASGCTLLHLQPEGCLGVYCVGTIPERRGHGVARAMMATAERLAADRGAETIVLQTVASDGVTPMYLKLGFATAFERDVLQVA